MTRGVPVPPAERPVKYRQAARVIVTANERVLLMADSDPGVPNSGWWVTPGGGIDDDEDWLDAAVRELFEETGLRIEREQLRGPVASRVVRHGYCDRVLVQQEMFFRLDLDEQFEPSSAGFTAEEQQTMQGFGWFSVDEMSRLQVWPAELANLVSREAGDQPADLGVADESTVALLPGQGDQLPAQWSASNPASSAAD